ncbi:MAG TPA: TetR/AcrR family transcriptional regulator [Streptosporangiaceae bacterium]|nr:TetR/AcrR family transcriptional regulator [Streptosporangiaceae bacterium]
MNLPTPRVADHHRAIAERNVDAILDATEALLERHGQASITAVAKEAGVSRVTVYSHFPTWDSLLEAAVQRAVGRTMASIESAQPADGPPAEALQRLLAAAWKHLGRYSAMAQAVTEYLNPEAVTRSHQAAHNLIGSLIERGQADGSFRTDLPGSWLVTASIALIHACIEEVTAGRIDESSAERILTVTIAGLFARPDSQTEGTR